MEYILYERPREKLRNRGVSYLTTVELVQLILGSGNARVSAARLAKEVGKRIGAGNFSFESLISVSGLGEAKVCQLLAARELGARLGNISHFTPTVSRGVLDSYTRHVRLSRSALLCIWFDGSNQEIGRKEYVLNTQQQQRILARAIFADALAVSARSVLLYVHKSGQDLGINAYELGLLGCIKESSKLLEVAVIDVIAINKKASKSWRAEL